MDLTEQQKAEIKQTYAVRFKRQMFVSIPFFVLLIASFVSRSRDSNTLMGLPGSVALPITVAVVGGVLFFSFRNWRCPACDAYLGRAFNPKHCANCATQLHD